MVEMILMVKSEKVEVILRVEVMEVEEVISWSDTEGGGKGGWRWR